MTERSFAERQEDVRRNLAYIRERMAMACREAGRSPDEVTLMAVTKTVPPEIIQTALDEGITLIGENRVQEYLEKRPRLGAVQVHLIGHLQTNKVKKIVGTVAAVQSVDSLRLAQAISDESQRQGLVTPVLAEVNIGDEQSKSGVSAKELLPLLCRMSELPGIRVSGLMAIPPAVTDSAEKRRNFSLLRHLFIDIAGKNIDNIHMDVLSMGMSNDYYEAILEGATMIRVGSALFGARV